MTRESVPIKYTRLRLCGLCTYTRLIKTRSHPDAAAAAGANKLHIRSKCAVKLAVSSPAPRKMTTLSWLPEAACAVQLNEPLSSVRPSMMANLWWKA